jgi:hypothetical protein
MPLATRKRGLPNRVVAISCLTLLFSVLVASAASAHPSDFRTLTVDLLFGPQGLEAIDAAVVEAKGPSYEPFPSVEYRQMVAASVLGALGLAESEAELDVELSERYHQVGFTIRFSRPSADRELLQFDTSQLQEVTTNLALDHLKVSVCAVEASLFPLLDIDASEPGRPPEARRQERSWCEIWLLSPDDTPVSISVMSPALPTTGTDIIPLAFTSLILFGMGIGLLGKVGQSHLESERRSHAHITS